MAMISGMLVPTAPMTARMMTVPGSDIMISVTRLMIPSARSPAPAAVMARIVPSPTPTITVMSDVPSVPAAEANMRLSRSRPSSSAPSQWAALGPERTAVKSWSSVLYGSHSVAVREATTRAASHTAPARPPGEVKRRCPENFARAVLRGVAVGAMEGIMRHATSGQGIWWRVRGQGSRPPPRRWR
jgi:hypothetical protein